MSDACIYESCFVFQARETTTTAASKLKMRKTSEFKAAFQRHRL